MNDVDQALWQATMETNKQLVSLIDKLQADIKKVTDTVMTYVPSSGGQVQYGWRYADDKIGSYWLRVAT